MVTNYGDNKVKSNWDTMVGGNNKTCLPVIMQLTIMTLWLVSVATKK